jgi:DNA-binding transcriptional ArsR family regulator
LSDKKTAKRQEYGKSTLDLHREIKSAVEKIAEKDEAPCVLVTVIEKELGKDPRTVRFHLRLLEESGYGRFASDGKLFCVKGSESKR